MFKTLKDFNVRNKKVLVRCDFNVPLSEKGEIADDFRIVKTLPTIEYLIKNKAKVILMSHLGDPEGRVQEKLRLTPVQEKLTELLDLSIIKAPDCVGQEIKKQIEEMQPGEIMLLENLRFHPEEEKNDKNFAMALADLADIYINDAFGCSHRAHSSISAITEYIPSGAGLLFEKEIKVLSAAIENPRRPLVAIIGGVKISTKIRLIKRLLEKADHLLVGGEIANTILAVKGICKNRPLPPVSVLKEVEEIDLNSPKLHLPIDLLGSYEKTGKVYRITTPQDAKNGELLLDIGPKTIDIFGEIVEEARTIILAGPLGLFEQPVFEKGTKEIVEKIISNHLSYKIIGGGETLFAAAKFGLQDKFDHVSTGGGAMLSYLGGEELPGLTALEKNGAKN